ncbi:MAG: hypothetical protein KY453_01045 [Gemmatimonadetes bacterium]|nr:hypothetical protein [Gemmatimonadota bacterium]
MSDTVRVDLGDRGGDLAEGQDADLLALGQQVLHLFEFLKLSYKHSRLCAPFLLIGCPGCFRTGARALSRPKQLSGGTAP